MINVIGTIKTIRVNHVVIGIIARIERKSYHMSRTYKDKLSRLGPCWRCKHHRKTTLAERVISFIATGEMELVTCTHRGEPFLKRNNYLRCHSNLWGNTGLGYTTFHDRRDRSEKKHQRQAYRTRLKSELRTKREDFEIPRLTGPAISRHGCFF